MQWIHHSASKGGDPVFEAMAREQLNFLIHRYKMDPQEIVCMYTGEVVPEATYEMALRAIVTHRATADGWGWYN